MLFVNQNDYPDMSYPTDTKHPDSECMTHGTIENAGCGLCSCCMVIDRLTMETLTLEECREMSMNSGANHEPGTDMEILAPVVAEAYDLHLETSNNMGELIECLQSGGCAILNPGGDREGYHGLFTSSGHYMTAISYHNGEILILDPSWSETKFQTPMRKGRVREAGCLVYATPEVIIEDTENRRPRYFLFSRECDRK
ncbi:hypothetical protein ACDL92_01435 [Ihubacter sp. mB4P-1]|uniref:hypothetical protein n=1 Tax=Ihubacter sp. mB4P-1 TaxID=3242370 RepID=UPI001379E982